MNKFYQIVTIKHIKDFLKTFGYEWDGLYYHNFMKRNDMEDRPMMAEKISDLRSEEFTFFTQLYTKVEENGVKRDEVIFVNFNFDYFILLEEDLQKKVIKDKSMLTKKWIMFLIENCGNDYVKLLKENLLEEMNRVNIGFADKMDDLNKAIKDAKKEYKNKMQAFKEEFDFIDNIAKRNDERIK